VLVDLRTLENTQVLYEFFGNGIGPETDGCDSEMIFHSAPILDQVLVFHQGILCPEDGKCSVQHNSLGVLMDEYQGNALVSTSRRFHEN
jgi:hypothetical protein